MGISYKVLKPKDLENAIDENQAFALDVLIGLSERPKRLPSRYFYDDRGSELFQQIMSMPEYYLTKSEFEILRTKTEEFANLLTGKSFNLVELGAGDGAKTKILIEHFLKKSNEFQYIPIDISEGAMKILMKTLKTEFASLNARGIVAEYFEGLKWLSNFTQQPNMVLFLGSNLGNFHSAQARVFLRSLWNTLNDGDLVVIGFDLKKDINLMLKAYNDENGITAEFNLNLLRRINRELGGNFDLNKFRFYSSYNVFSGAIESYLVSQEAQTVFIEAVGQLFDFQAWEPIHTEYSYKYLHMDIEQLAKRTGYTIEKQLYDSKRYFVNSIWKVEKAEAAE